MQSDQETLLVINDLYSRAFFIILFLLYYCYFVKGETTGRTFGRSIALDLVEWKNRNKW